MRMAWCIGGLAWLVTGLAAAPAASAGLRASRLDLARLDLHEAYAPDRRPTVWEAPHTERAPPIAAIALDPEQLDADANEIGQRIDWPQVVAFQAGPMDSETPAYATRGAVRRKSRDERAVDRLRDLGVEDGQALGDQGRWYLFAATSGRAVGLNLLNDGEGVTSGGWTTDATSTLLTDAQFGLGYRRGDTQTSLGYLHRDVKGRRRVVGVTPPGGEMVGLSVSVKPAR